VSSTLINDKLATCDDDDSYDETSADGKLANTKIAPRCSIRSRLRYECTVNVGGHIRHVGTRPLSLMQITYRQHRLLSAANTTQAVAAVSPCRIPYTHLSPA
jgi:hypothetical protein